MQIKLLTHAHLKKRIISYKKGTTPLKTHLWEHKYCCKR